MKRKAAKTQHSNETEASDIQLITRRTLVVGAASLGLLSRVEAYSKFYDGNSVALLVGVEHYENDKVSSLRFASKDVTAVANVLREKFRFSDVRVMSSDFPSSKNKPTSNNVINAIDRYVQDLGPSDTFVLYFSGHGIVRDGATYLATQDADPTSTLVLSRSTIPLELLQKYLKMMKSRQVILIIDACRNDPEKGKGDADNLLQRGFAKDLEIAAQAASDSTGGSSAVLFACSEGERAYEEPDFGHSVFTKFFLDALSDDTGSGSVEDIVSFTRERVQKWAKENGNRQTPDLHKFGSGNLTLGYANGIPNGGAIVSTAVRLDILGTPDGATIKVDEVPLRGTVFTDEIADRKKEVEVSISASGFRPYVRKVMLTRGSSSSVRVMLEPKAEPEKPVLIPKPKPANRLSDYSALRAYIESLRSIPAGTFPMGSTSGLEHERPKHIVSLSAFRMGETPVTVAVWLEYCAATGKPLPTPPSWGMVEDHPIVNVSWNDIMGSDGTGGFCSWASEMAGIRLILPTEAQWEYAARSRADGQAFPWGNAFDDSKAWCSVKANMVSTAPVNRLVNIYRNVYGLSDLVGNVGQWCYDMFIPYGSGAKVNPIGRSTRAGNFRCVRGGSWNFDDSDYLRCANRYRDRPDNWNHFLGFRLSAGPG